MNRHKHSETPNDEFFFLPLNLGAGPQVIQLHIHPQLLLKTIGNNCDKLWKILEKR